MDVELPSHSRSSSRREHHVDSQVFHGTQYDFIALGDLFLGAVVGQ